MTLLIYIVHEVITYYMATSTSVEVKILSIQIKIKYVQYECNYKTLDIKFLEIHYFNYLHQLP